MRISSTLGNCIRNASALSDGPIKHAHLILAPLNQKISFHDNLGEECVDERLQQHGKFNKTFIRYKRKS